MSEKDIRIGAYVCYCGGNISDVVDCEQVAETLRGLPNVVVVRTDLSMCSDAGQSLIEEDIKEKGVNRVVVGACAPSLHEVTFRKAVARAGLNPYLYHHVCLREQDSWVHQSNPDEATAKAGRLMLAGIAKARMLEQLDTIRLEAEQHALVIGGGIAGLRTAWDAAQRGIRVTLIEKSPFLGGHMAQLETIFPTGENARQALHELIEKVVSHFLVTVYTNAELTSARGYMGDFRVTITAQPRGVAEDFAHFDEAAAACPVEVPDDFNYGLTTRKAIYLRYPDAIPNTPAIDWKACTRCGECKKVNGTGIDLDGKPQTIDLTVGAVVVATGFQPYQPREGEFGYGQFPEVVTLPQMIRLMTMQEGNGKLTWNGHPVNNIALIHCVGSREIPGVHEPQEDGRVNDYCSRICCTATLQMTNELHERFPYINLFDLHEDIRTYSRGHEDIYTEASKNGVRFLRFHGDERPEVTAAPPDDTSPLLVRVKDYLTWGKELEVPADLVVLATGMMPNPVSDIVKLLKITEGNDRFLLEVHPKLQPVETAVPGVILAGTAQGPMNIQETCSAASAAAAKVGVLLGQGQVSLEPFVARVNHDLCDGSGQCVAVCAYEDAIALEPVLVDGKTVQKAVVSPANCVGCGVCVSVCPNHAIDVQGWTLEQYEAMVDAITADLPKLEVVE
ncbi:MAG: CoB--CoM heterodisulfide reductase iron-sulfur subunit A family protein [Anaerolineae bacterium]|nr:CoB--CoM heterodisulfide reductase iron-sulfur subunit A family protein [Anaerolineae bacterium]